MKVNSLRGLDWLDINSIVAVPVNKNGEPYSYTGTNGFAVFRRQPTGGFASQADRIQINKKLWNIRNMAISPTGRYGVFVGIRTFRDTPVDMGDPVIIDLFTDKAVARLTDGKNRIASATFSADGRILTISHAAGFTFWDTTTWQKAAVIPSASPQAAGKEHLEVACVSQDSRLAAIFRTVTVRTATGEKRDDTIAIWDLQQGKLLHDIKPKGVSHSSDANVTNEQVFSRLVSFDALGKTFVVIDKGMGLKGREICKTWSLETWDVASGKQLLSFAVEDGP